MKKKLNKKLILFISIPAFIVLVSLIVLSITFFSPSLKYNKANSLIEQKRYEEAINIYSELGDYSDSKNQIDIVNAHISLNQGDYETAIEYIYQIGGTINVTYDGNEGSLLIKSEQIKKLKHINNIATRDGYTFYGWTIDNYSIDNDNYVLNLSLKASWDVIYYTISYNLNGGQVDQDLITTYTTLDEVIVPNVYKKGYTFAGWKEKYSDDMVTDLIIQRNSMGNREYTAFYYVNQYSISFDCNEGEPIEDLLVNYGSGYSLPVAKRNGYEFVGWELDGKVFEETVYTFDYDISLKAQWKIKEYYIVYHDIEINNDYPSIYKITDEISLPNVSLEGYTFLGWKDSNTNHIFENNIIPKNYYVEGSVLNLEVIKEKKLYIVSFDSQIQQTFPNMEVYYTDNITLPTPNKEGYDFLGWICEESEEKFIGNIQYMFAKNINFIATYKAKDDIKYVVNHHYENIENDNYDEVKSFDLFGSADELVEVTPFEKEGFIMPISQQITIKADGSSVVDFYYQREEYTLTFVSNGGNKVEPITAKYESEIKDITTSKGGYTFDGWYYEETLINKFDGKIPAKDQTLFAYYKEENKPGDFTYSLIDGYYQIDKYVSNNYKCVIPTHINGIKVKTIKSKAFDDNDNLLVVYFNDNIESIEENAFYNCDGLVIYTSVNESNAFENISNVSKIYYGINNNNSITINGVVYIIQDNIAIVSKYDNQSSEVSIENSVEINNINYPVQSIGKSAFAFCDELVTLSIPSSIKLIEENILHGCSSLESLSIPFIGESEHSINEKAVLGYMFSKNSFDKSYSVNQYYSSNQYVTYYLPISLKEVNVSGGTLHYGAFYNCNKIETIVLEDKITVISDASFANCTNLYKINIKGKVTSVGVRAFSRCVNISEIHFEEGLVEIKERAFNECNSLIVFNLPSTVKTIGKYAFFDCNLLRTIKLSSNLQEVASNAFYGCSSLIIYYQGKEKPSAWDNMWNPSNRPVYYDVNESNYLFDDRYSLEFVVYSNEAILTNFINYQNDLYIPSFIVIDGVKYDVVSIGSYACNNNIITEVSIPNTIVSIGESAFANNNSLNTIRISKNIATIGKNAFEGCDNLYIYCEASEQPSKWNLLWNIDNRPVVWGISENSIVVDGMEIMLDENNNVTLLKVMSNEETITIPSFVMYKDQVINIKTIGYNVLENCENVKILKIKNGIENINEGAFKGCSNLQYIYLPFVGSGLNASSNTAFGYIFGTEYFENATISYHQEGSYYIPNSLKLVSISDGSITEGAFNNCIYIETISFNSDVNIIGENIFGGCSNLSSLTFSMESIPGDFKQLFSKEEYDNAYSVEYGLEKRYIPNSLSNITILSGDIFESAFDGFSSLNNVEFEGNLYTIGANSFANCNGIQSIEIPSTVTTIEEGAFSNCSNLNEVIIPEGVKYIYDNAFSNCDSLTEITLPNTLQSLGENVFYDCDNIETLTTPFVGYSRAVNDNSKSTIGFNFGANGTSENFYSAVQQNTSYKLPKSLKTVNLTDTKNIKEEAFANCDYIQNVTLNEGVEKIQAKAFKGCDMLKSIIIPNGVTTIGEFAFYENTSMILASIPETTILIGKSAFQNCNEVYIFHGGDRWNFNMYDQAWNYNSRPVMWNKRIDSNECELYLHDSINYLLVGNEAIVLSYLNTYSSSTTIVDIPLYITVGSNDYIVTTIANEAFSARNVTKVNMPETISYIGEKAFKSSIITSMDLPDNVTYIGEKAFESCSSLESINIPKGVNIIYESTFSNCTKLKEVILHDDILEIGKEAFYYCRKLETLVLPKNLTHIGEESFANCSSLSSIEFNNNLKTISYQAFYKCTSLVEVNLSDSIETIGNECFSNCTSLTKIKLSNNLNSLSLKLFNKTNIESVEIPSSVQIIGASVFNECSNLQYLYIPKTVSNIDPGAFYGISDVVICFEDDLYKYGSLSNSNNYLYENIESMVIDNGNIYVIEKNNGAILAKYNKEDTLPIIRKDIEVDGKIIPVTTIGKYAFKDNTMMETLIMPDSIITIGESAFSGCSSLEKVIMSKNVKNLDKGIFQNCINLKEVELPDGITSIGLDAFNGCESLESIYLPDTLHQIFSDAFKNCGALVIYCQSTEDRYSSSLNYDNIPVYYNVDKEDFVTIDDATYLINNDQAILEEVITNDSIYSIRETIEYNGVSYDVTTIGKHAFIKSSDINQIILPDSIKVIEIEAFAQCSNLRHISISNANIETIKTRAFYNCSSLEEFFIPESVTDLEYEIFKGCGSLNSITFSFIEENTNMDSLGYLFGKDYYDSSYAAIQGKGNSSFYLPKSLKRIIVRSGVIYESAFANTTSLSEILFANGVSEIENNAFKGCSQLTLIELSNTITKIGDNAFEGCELLRNIFIPDNVAIMGSNVFNNCSLLTIVYCEAEEKPSLWKDDWCTFAQVVWGVSGAEVE